MRKVHSLNCERTDRVVIVPAVTSRMIEAKLQAPHVSMAGITDLPGAGTASHSERSYWYHSSMSYGARNEMVAYVEDGMAWMRVASRPVVGAGRLVFNLVIDKAPG
jgi:hypothetical protein